MGLLDVFHRKKSTENKTVDTRDRYSMEHIILPKLILGENGIEVLSAILSEKGQFFVKIYEDMNKNIDNYQCPYQRSQFVIDGMRFEDNDNLYAVQIQMPIPEREPLCKMIIITHDANLENRRYITIEMDSSGYCMCEWIADGRHINYGKFSANRLLEIMKG